MDGGAEGVAPGAIGTVTPPVREAAVGPQNTEVLKTAEPTVSKVTTVEPSREILADANTAEGLISEIPPRTTDALTTIVGAEPISGPTGLSPEAHQAQIQEQARVNAYAEITGLRIPLDENSTVDGVMDQIRAQGYPWQNDEATRAHIAGAIEHAKAKASQPEAEQPGASDSAVAADLGSEDGQPAEAGDAPAGDRTPGQGAEGETGTSTTSGEGAASSDGATEDSTAPTSETTDTTASSEKPLTPEQRIANLERIVGNQNKVIEKFMGKLKELDKNGDPKWWEWMILLATNVMKPVVFDQTLAAFEAEMGGRAS